jgi:hypothetical protein
MAGFAAAAASKLVGSKLGLTVSLVGVVAIAVPSVAFLRSHAAPETRGQACVACTLPTAPPVGPVSLPVLISAPAFAPAPAQVPAGVEAPSGEPASSETVSGGTLAAELAVVDGARSFLARHRPGEALKELERHQRRYPAGLLGPEAEVIRIEALAEAGHKDEAATRARAFTAAHAGSLLAHRVKSYLPPS